MAKTCKKEFISQTFKMRADLVERLDMYRAQTGVSKTFAIEKALEKYLDEVAPVTDKKA